MRFEIRGKGSFTGEMSEFIAALEKIGVVLEDGSSVIEIEELPTEREGFRQIQIFKGNSLIFVLSVPADSSVEIPPFSVLISPAALKAQIRAALIQAGTEPSVVMYWVFAAAAELRNSKPGWQPFF